jgi:hypothetical protein
MVNLTYEEKLSLMRSLNWDYLDKHEDMLAVIEGKLETSGSFTRDKLFVRSLERLTWCYIVGLWGTENIKNLYTPEIAGQIFPEIKRKHFDFALAILRDEPLPEPVIKWGDKSWAPEVYNSPRYKMFEELEKIGR